MNGFDDSRENGRRFPGGLALPLAALLTLFSCSGGPPDDRQPPEKAQARLESVHYGRLVDVYAYRRVDPDSADRLHPSGRRPVLIERDVLIDPFVKSEDPFSTSSARFRFMPFDPSVGHRELLILFDDQHPDERVEFEAALRFAKAGLIRIQPHASFQAGPVGPAPVVPSDASLVMTYDRPLGLGADYFFKTPTAVQVHELIGDPGELPPLEAYRPVLVRVIPKENGKRLIIDPEVSGRETRGRNANPAGLPPSLGRVAANVRIALPTSGVIHKTMRIMPDSKAQLNSVDLRNETAVIRDFRIANQDDPDFGGLPRLDAPELRAVREMGITKTEVLSEKHPETGALIERRILTINKRSADLVIRGRIPFVEGPLSATNGLPLGPGRVPQNRPFQNGDVIYQDQVSPATGELVRIKAEVIRNLGIVDTEGTQKEIGSGGGGAIARLEVSTLEAVDGAGNVMSFKASDLPLGETCVALVHYHDQIKLSGSDVGDGAGTASEVTSRRAEFLTFDPAPPRLDRNRQLVPPNQGILPNASVMVYFSKPMAMETVRTEDNVVVANMHGNRLEFVDDVKTGNLVVVPTSATDADQDATSVRLSTPLGLFHMKNNPNPAQDDYYIHLKDGKTGLRDRSGQTLDIFDDVADLEAITFKFTLDPEAESNWVGSVARRMNDPDEDGTNESGIAPDYFGQFQHDAKRGRLLGGAPRRFIKNCDRQNLSVLLRGDRGECTTAAPIRLYSTLITPGPIHEPLSTFGSRLQATWREDDFTLSETNAFDMELDIERMYWSPWIRANPKILFDVFDRVSIMLGTSEKRPDIRVMNGGTPTNPACVIDPKSKLSGLMRKFARNYVDNSTRAIVVKDRIMSLDPNDLIASETGESVIALPEFRTTYTWRDRRITGWDSKNDVAVGLGGAQNPTAQKDPDTTADITSPWIPEIKPGTSGYDSQSADDFKGNREQDFSPIALPLLLDFWVYPDDPDNAVAGGLNLWQSSKVDAPFKPFPWLRVHSTGHKDPNRNNFIVRIDPENEKTAAGTAAVPPGDDILYWSRVQFERRISVLTFGYIDTLKPAKNDVSGPTGWQGRGDGFPVFQGLAPGIGPGDFAVLMRPKPNDLPAGTRVVVEFRGAEAFDKPDVYRFDPKETATSRNNLLNPGYACEQYRYATSNRVKASGLTNYVRKPELLVDQTTGVAPRFLNWRLTLVNNTEVEPAVVPFVDYFAITFRHRQPR